jgi:hypothetical protein
MKCGRPIVSNDKNPQIRKGVNMKYDPGEDMKIPKKKYLT